MPSFDIVSEVNAHELANAVDQANRELSVRYDFRNVDASFKQEKQLLVVMLAESDFQLKQMIEILKAKMTSRNIDIKCLDIEDHYGAGKLVKQQINVRQGIDQTISKEIVKRIKESKIKVQSSIQGEQVRVTGKKRDDLQEVITLLKQADLKLPLQYQNFRD